MDLFKYLNTMKVPGWVALLMMVVFLLIIIVIKWDSVSKMFSFFKKTGRTCSDCIMIIIGIREKYESEIDKIERCILKAQMNYVEMKLQEIIFYLVGTFKQDIDHLKTNQNEDCIKMEMSLYREALKNSVNGAVKDELRRSFKENGFVEMSEIEFAQYVKQKYRNLLSVARDYLSQYYIESENTIVALKHRFESFNDSRFEEMTFDVFRNARDIVRDAKIRSEDLKNKFMDNIDNFLKNKSLPEGIS